MQLDYLNSSTCDDTSCGDVPPDNSDLIVNDSVSSSDDNTVDSCLRNDSAVLHDEDSSSSLSDDDLSDVSTDISTEDSSQADASSTTADGRATSVVSMVSDSTDATDILTPTTLPDPSFFGTTKKKVKKKKKLRLIKKKKKSSSQLKIIRPKTALGTHKVSKKKKIKTRPKTSHVKKKKKSSSNQSWFEIKPLFKSQKPTVCFATGCETKEDFQDRFPDRKVVNRTSGSSNHPVLYYSLDKSIDYTVIKNAFKSAGFKRIKPHSKNWSVRWGRCIKHYEYEQLKPFQRVSHFPGSWEIGNKLKLNNNLMKMKKIHPKDYKFFPSAYVLPQDYDLVMKEYAKNENMFYILKPFNSSCGRGIRVVNSKKSIPEKEKCLCQQYIPNPLLINKRKFDLRLYIVVSSFNPLTIYRFHDGLARFATQDYDMSSLGSYSHLTNYSVNKHNENFKAGDNDDDSSKWSVLGLRKYFAENNIDDGPLWEKVDELVVKTLISVDFEVNSMRKMHCRFKDSAFELLGFDVLIDESMNPWLVEINLGASLSLSSPLDRRIKTELVHQMFHMVGFESVERKKMKKYKNHNNAEAFQQTNYEKEATRKKKKYEREALRAERVKKIKKKGKITKLLTDERKMVEKSQEEYSRRGDFYRIHPTPQSLKKYNHLFREERFRNFVLGKFLELPEEDQERLLKK